MSPELDTADFAEYPEFHPHEVDAVRALQVRMMRADVVAGGRDKAVAVKSRRLEEFVAVLAALSAGAGPGPGGAHPEPPVPVTVESIAARAGELAAAVKERSRAVMALAELMVFDPWPAPIRWNRTARRTALELAAGDLPGLGAGDLALMNREFETLMRALQRKSIRWHRVAAVTAVGLAAGVATGGLAAPAVGAAIGSTLGLSGAAATSAGLAALGGGSIAAGGLGVTGGTWVVAGVAGLTGAGAVGAGARYSRLGRARVGVEAIKLDLISQVVLAEAADREQKMRRVVESLHQAQNELATKINQLTERISELKARNAVLAEDNNILRSTVGRLRAELREFDSEVKRLRAELEIAKEDKATVDIVLDRIPEPVRQ